MTPSSTDGDNSATADFRANLIPYGGDMYPEIVGPRAGAMVGGAIASPREMRMLRTVVWSVMKAKIRIAAPQCGQRSGNTSSMQASSSAQDSWRCDGDVTPIDSTPAFARAELRAEHKPMAGQEACVYDRAPITR